MFTHAVDHPNVIVAVLYSRNVIIILQSATINTNPMHNENRRGKSILRLVSTVRMVQSRGNAVSDRVNIFIEQLPTSNHFMYPEYRGLSRFNLLQRYQINMYSLRGSLAKYSSNV